MLGKIEGIEAILIIEKTAFNVNINGQSGLLYAEEMITSMKLLEHNDIYHWFLGTAKQDLDDHPSLKISMIYPATQTVNC